MSGDDLIDVIHFADLLDECLPGGLQHFDGDVIEQVLDKVEHPMTQRESVVVPLTRREFVIPHNLVRNPNPAKKIKNLIKFC